MSTEIICNATGRETRVAVVEDGRVVELRIDRGDERGMVGNIYLGRVVRVVPGMQAAFVDVGLDRAVFLYGGDINPNFLSLHTPDAADTSALPSSAAIPDELPDPDDSSDDDTAVQHTHGRNSHRAPIESLLKVGQQLVVQIAKDPISSKGARATTKITIPGRYLILTPETDHTGVSRRIPRERDRLHLQDIIDSRRPKGAGFIVRTVCVGKSADVLHADMKYLVATWDKIKEAALAAKAPAALYCERSLIVRTIRDLADENVSKIIVDRKDHFDEVRAFVSDFIPELDDRVQRYTGDEPVFDTYGVEDALFRNLGRKVGLKSGGHLIIDQTEALMAIDVNSGRFTGNTNKLEDTTLRTNLEAVDEIVYQLRLRNMGGIIIIDLIDMEQAANRERVQRALETALRADRARTNVLSISDLGVVEMTRKRTQEGLDRYMYDTCQMCEGAGVIRGHSTVAFDILRKVRREMAKVANPQRVVAHCTPAVADLLYGEHYTDLEAIEADIGQTVVVVPVAHFSPGTFQVTVQ